MGRASLGIFESTLLGVVAAERKLTMARELLNHCQARFAQRPLSRPRYQQGPEEVMERQGAALIARLWGAATLRPGETAEEQRWGRSRSFSGRVVVERRESAFQAAKGWRKSRDTLFSDGPGLDSGRVGAAADRISSDGMGPGQRLAIAIHEVGGQITSCNVTATDRWTPAHQGAEAMRQPAPGQGRPRRSDPQKMTRRSYERPVCRK